jgi:uncharacterized protein
MTSDLDRQRLLGIARATIHSHLTHAPLPAPDLSGAMGRPGGAFVSLHKHGELRGCIGHIEADAPLGSTIVSCAVAAATEDPRFPPLVTAELADIDIELSLLGPLQSIGGPEDIEIGRDGLVVEQGWHRGLLLPQVATEWQWDAETFLAHTCRKAGLSADAWKQGARLWRFEAEVFGEPARAGH